MIATMKMGSLELDWKRTYVMGVVNVTPDSFSDGGRYLDPAAALDHGLELLEAGADILDVGGESTRPGAAPVDGAEEKRRVLPVIEALCGRTNAPVSIDTTKSTVADAAVRAGARCINDVSGLTMDPELARVAARHEVGLVLGHIRGTPRTMQQHTDYADCVATVIETLKRSLHKAQSAGVASENIIVDPGIGFGKNVRQNLKLILAAARIRRACARAVLIGPSRKSFIGKLSGAPPTDRVGGTVAACTVAVLYGADIVRVHDVAAVRQAMQLADAFVETRAKTRETVNPKH